MGALGSMPSTSRPSGKEATSYGADFSQPSTKRQLNRIGNHVFGMDPAHNPYYNWTEHGTYLLREAITQKTGKLPPWAQ